MHKTAITCSKAPASRRGALGKGCMIGGGIVGALLLVVLVVVMWGRGAYNGMYGSRERVKAQWSEIDNQYKRRYDLVPQLVATVKGAADFEQSTLDQVTQARASVGKVQLPSDVPTDPEQLRAYIQAQQSLSGALGRMFAVAEAYPQLKASQNFLSLQDQLEGTENRIATARRDYIEAVRAYNTQIGMFPGNFIAGMFHFAPAATIEATVEERTTPKVEFDFNKKK